MSKFTELLTKKREEKHMLKIDVANLFGWTPMYYGRYENGYLKPTKNNIQIFAKFLEIPVEELKKIVEEN